jgi:hypothetical protein
MTEERAVSNPYRNGKIYTIRSYQTDRFYIGSTCNSLSKRLHGHRGNYNKYKNGKQNYMTSYEIMQYDDNYIELLELCPCSSNMELHRREGELIRQHDNCVNKVIAGRTHKEYYEENKEHLSSLHKEYYERNKERLLPLNRQNNKEYYKLNKEEVDEKHRQYYNTNKESVNQKHNLYYSHNKQQLNITARRKYQAKAKDVRACECGVVYDNANKSTKNRHITHKQHQDYLSSLTSII